MQHMQMSASHLKLHEIPVHQISAGECRFEAPATVAEREKWPKGAQEIIVRVAPKRARVMSIQASQRQHRNLREISESKLSASDPRVDGPKQVQTFDLPPKNGLLKTLS